MIASCFGLAAFAAAVVVGWWVGNDAATVIYRAMLVMLVCWVIGYGVGRIGQYVVDQRIEAYRQANPMPEDLTTPRQQAGGSPPLADSNASPQAAAHPSPGTVA